MTSSPSPRRSYAKSAARKDAIAQAVLEIVNEKGHRALTSLEVARRTKMNESTVLYHFPTRDHLLVAALQRNETSPLARHVAGGDLYDAAPEIATRAVDRLNLARLFVAMGAEATDPAHPAHEFFVRHNAATIAVLARDLRRRQTAGLVPPSLDAARVARQIIAVWDGLQAQWLVDPSFDISSELSRAMSALTGNLSVAHDVDLGNA